VDLLEAVGTFRDGRTGEWGGISISAGAPAFWIVLALILILIVLYRSMRKHLRRIDFNDSTATSEQSVDDAGRGRSES
jgi:hypothetical protein